MSQVSAPVSTTVISSDVAGSGLGEAVIQGFGRLLEIARGLGFVTTEAERPGFTLTLAPELAVGPALSTLAAAAARMKSGDEPSCLRSMVHFGVVFRTESPQGVSFVGSAIRSTQSALRRAPNSSGFLATADFAAHAETQPGLPFSLQPMGKAVDRDSLYHLVFRAETGKDDVQAAGLDPDFVAFARKRFADAIGPFAAPLVDRALKTAGTRDQLCKVLAKEIDNPGVRQRFHDDLHGFSNARN